MPSLTEDEKKTLSVLAFLFFRLGMEEREISVPRDDTVELCIVQALIAGPSSAYQDLTPVFSPDTRVVSTSRSGETVTVTLTRAFLDAPSDAPDDWESLPYWRSEVMLRRRLAILSIVSALTENGIGVDYIYAFVGKTQNRALVIFRVENTETAAEVLKRAGVMVLEDEEVYSL